MFSDHDEMSPLIAAVSAPSLVRGNITYTRGRWQWTETIAQGNGHWLSPTLEEYGL